MSTNNKIYLASASPRRRDLLTQISCKIESVMHAEIDEAPVKGELVEAMTVRLAREKGEAVAVQIQEGFVISGDTAIEIGRKTLGKARDNSDVERMIERLSGRKHRVYSTVYIALVKDGVIVKSASKTSKTTITVKRIQKIELDEYIKSGQGIGLEGGFCIQGLAGAFVKSISGSYSGVVGLPLYETKNLLTSLGYKA
jgi:septum formation protein